jgi:hypothetical protein
VGGLNFEDRSSSLDWSITNLNGFHHGLSPAVAEKTAQEWESDRDQFHSHFAEMKSILDMEGQNYAS